MKRIGIFYHPAKEAACTLAKEVTEFLRERRLAVWLCSAWEWEKASQQVNGTDLVLSIGGDETGSSNQFNGYIDDLRITKGVARYTRAFTPHTSAHPHAYSGATENALIYDNITPY